MDALKGSQKLLSGNGFPVRSINDSSCSRESKLRSVHSCWGLLNRATALLRDLFWLFSPNRDACFFVLFFCLYSVSSIFRLQVHLSFEFQIFFLSDIVVRCFAQRLPQSDLQGHEGAHRHVKEDLPDVPQFVQIHVGKTDECKGQEGLAVPPD